MYIYIFHVSSSLSLFETTSEGSSGLRLKDECYKVQNDAWDYRLTVLDYHFVRMSDYAFLDVFSSARFANAPCYLQHARHSPSKMHCFRFYSHSMPFLLFHAVGIYAFTVADYP